MDLVVGSLLVLVVAIILIAILRRLKAQITTSSILARLYADERIVVGPTEGSETIANSGDILTFLDPDFERWGTNVPGEPTKAREVKVYEMREDATFERMFGSLGDPKSLCLSQGQIRRFIEEHRDKLHPSGWATFFLFEVKGEIFVAFAIDEGNDLKAGVGRFVSDGVFSADVRRRVVVPGN